MVDFTNQIEDIENCFMIHFLWYRALDRDLIEYKNYESPVDKR